MESHENQDRMKLETSGIKGMNRRTFIKATGVFGLSTALPWSNLYAREQKSTQFLKKRSAGNMLFPRPGDGTELPISIYDQDGDNLLDPEVLAEEIVETIEAALVSFREVASDLNGNM